jgi:hypothetical protein
MARAARRVRYLFADSGFADHERHPATTEAIIRWATIATMTRGITPRTTRHPTRTTPIHYHIEISNTL